MNEDKTNPFWGARRTAKLFINDVLGMQNKYSLSFKGMERIFPLIMLGFLVDKEITDPAWTKQATKEYIEFWFWMLNELCVKSGVALKDIAESIPEFQGDT